MWLGATASWMAPSRLASQVGEFESHRSRVRASGRTARTSQALTTISQHQPGPQSLGSLKRYFDANPHAGRDMQQLQSPLGALSSRGKPALTLPQVLGLMQATQNQAPALATPALPGGPPAGLPGAMQTAQASAGPGIFAPARPSPAAAGTRGSGPLPGPSAVAAG